MYLKAIFGLFLATIILITIMPSENDLGESYKLIYFHVPVTVVTIGTLALFPFLHFKISIPEIRSFSVVTSIYSAIHLVISSLFMYVAWGGLIFSEVRFVFSLTLFLFALSHSILCFIETKLARIYSFLIYAVFPYFYLKLTNTQFQLHPTFVQMPLLFYVPYIFSFPLIILFYFMIKNYLKNFT